MVNQSRKSGLSSESSADSQTNGSRSTKPRKSRSISPNTEVKDILLNMREESSKSKMRQFKLNNVRDWVAWFSRPRKENHDRKLFWPAKLPVNRLFYRSHDLYELKIALDLFRVTLCITWCEPRNYTKNSCAVDSAMIKVGCSETDESNENMAWELIKSVFHRHKLVKIYKINLESIPGPSVTSFLQLK